MELIVKCLGALFGLAGISLIFEGDPLSGLIGVMIGLLAFSIPKSRWKKMAENSEKSAAAYRAKVAAQKAQDELNKTERSIELPIKVKRSTKKFHIRRDADNLYYFDENFNKEAERFQFDSYEWAGPNVSLQTNSSGTSTANVKSGSYYRNEREKDIKEVNHGTSVTYEQEEDTQATLYFKSVSATRYEEIVFINNRVTDSKVRGFLGIK